MLLDLSHNRSVVANADVEAEVAPVDLAESDRAEVGGIEASCEVLDRFDRIVRHPEGARKYVGRAAG